MIICSSYLCSVSEIICVFILISLATGAELTTHTTDSKNDTITVSNFINQVNADGSYGFDIVQSNGLKFKEVGFGGHYAKGAYQYIAPDGQKISVLYTADDTGFHPQSRSIPTAPPIPAYILKALKYINEHPTAEELADRKVRAIQT